MTDGRIKDNPNQVYYIVPFVSKRGCKYFLKKNVLLGINHNYPVSKNDPLWIGTTADCESK